MNNALENFIINNTQWGSDINADARQLEYKLHEYSQEMLAGMWEKQGIDQDSLASLSYKGPKVPLDFDFYDMPSPLNPNQYPTIEDIDAIRHFYGPKEAMEKHGVATGFLSSLGHEASLANWSNLANAEQSLYDIYNNLAALQDYFSSESDSWKGSTVSKFLNQPGLIDPLDFEMISKAALKKAKVPPKYKKRGEYVR